MLEEEIILLRRQHINSQLTPLLKKTYIRMTE